MQPRRRWFQFGLRSLLIATLVLCLGLGFYVNARRKSQEQWEAVRAIWKENGDLGVMGPKYGVITDPILIPDVPKWQISLGIDLPPFTVFAGSDSRRVMPQLKKLPQLEGAMLFDNDIDNSDLEAFAKFSKLKYLWTASGEITDEGLLHFAKHTNFQEAHIRGAQLTDRSLAMISGLPNLKMLTWKSNQATDAGLLPLRGNRHLLELDFQGGLLTDEALECLATCEVLEAIAIRSPNAFTGRGVGELARLKKLRRFQLYDSPLTTDGLSALSQQTTLEMLELTGPVLPEDLAHLAPLKSLYSLVMTNAKLDGEGLRNLSALKQLRRLEVGMAGLSDDDMELLASFSNLSDVNLKGSSITDVGLLKLAEMKGLERLELGGTRVTAGGINRFNKLSPFVFMYVSNAPSDEQPDRQ